MDPSSLPQAGTVAVASSRKVSERDKPLCKKVRVGSIADATFSTAVSVTPTQKVSSQKSQVQGKQKASSGTSDALSRFNPDNVKTTSGSGLSGSK